jgi:hypothetical protein
VAGTGGVVGEQEVKGSTGETKSSTGETGGVRSSTGRNKFKNDRKKTGMIEQEKQTSSTE